eukprot:CAMPEP_0117452624 /NCGR_PEP_ID=MMETSP0759-20121206/9728_1 /TAXON_ID=63605 /ORGANISM="Percolomonas cosmopolitus, Strain WS" /LENGTH=310 /DNA_ID=CAMNT_0005245479 /DNA_START=198 /DNA_END=1130 /DNA_ORIENTATION=-
MASHTDAHQPENKIKDKTFHFGSSDPKQFAEATVLSFADENEVASEREDAKPLLFGFIKQIINRVSDAVKAAQEAAKREAAERAERERIAREKEEAFQRMLQSSEDKEQKVTNSMWDTVQKGILDRVKAKENELKMRQANKPHGGFTIGETQEKLPDEKEATTLSVFTLNRLKDHDEPNVHDAETLAIFSDIEQAYQLQTPGQSIPEVNAPALEEGAIAAIYERCHFKGKKFLIKDTTVAGNWASSFGSAVMRKGYEFVLFAKENYEGKKKNVDQNDDCVPAHWDSLVKAFKVREKSMDNVVQDVLETVA